MWRICIGSWMTWRLASSPWAGRRYSEHGCVFLVVTIEAARHGLEISGGGDGAGNQRR